MFTKYSQDMFHNALYTVKLVRDKLLDFLTDQKVL